MSLLEAVERWLPPPGLLRMDGLGIDISESSLKYVGFKPGHTGSTLHVAEWGDVPIENDILSRGEIKNIPALAEVVKKVKTQTGRQYVRLSLPEERVYLFETEVDPTLSREEMCDFIEYKMEENVPVSPRDSYFDYQIFQSRGEKSATAAVTVAPRTIIDAYHDTCRQAGVVPLSFEVEPQAMARAVIPKGDPGTHMLVDFGKTRTGLGIVHQGVLLYTSTADVGGREVSEALRKTLGDKKEEELTILKNEQGLVRGKDNKVFEAILPTISAIKDEIQLRIQYWNDKNAATARPIEQIILCGGSANMRGLTEYLSETLGIETVMADVWQNAFDSRRHTPPIDRRHAYGYATAIGLGLASFIEEL